MALFIAFTLDALLELSWEFENQVRFHLKRWHSRTLDEGLNKQV